MNLLDLLPPGMSPEMAITAMASLTALGCVAAVWNALVTHSPMDARVKRLKRRREQLKAGWTTQQRHAMRRARAMGVMQQVTRRLNLLRSEATGRFAEKLSRAGWRNREALAVFAFAKICLPFVVGGGAYVFFDLLGLGALPAVAQTLIPFGAAILGAYVPEIFVNNAIQKRQKAIQKGMPDGLDLLVICAEAGLSLEAALTRVSGELARGCPELADELGLTAVELGFLPERRKAIENLNRRCQLPSMRGVTNTLLQTEKYGTPLANALRVLSAEFRNERMLKAEEKAARLPATLTVPMMIFILPTLFIVLGGPAVLKILDTLKGF
jgi:tight adherence protein C